MVCAVVVTTHVFDITGVIIIIITTTTFIITIIIITISISIILSGVLEFSLAVVSAN